MYEYYSRKKKTSPFGQPLHHYLINESDTRRNHSTPQTRKRKGKSSNIDDRPKDILRRRTHIQLPVPDINTIREIRLKLKKFHLIVMHRSELPMVSIRQLTDIQ